jgi:hypothetical protein
MEPAEIDLTEQALPGARSAEELLKLEISPAGIKQALESVLGLTETEADAVLGQILRRLAGEAGAPCRPFPGRP